MRIKSESMRESEDQIGGSHGSYVVFEVNGQPRNVLELRKNIKITGWPEENEGRTNLYQPNEGTYVVMQWGTQLAGMPASHMGAASCSIQLPTHGLEKPVQDDPGAGGAATRWETQKQLQAFVWRIFLFMCVILTFGIHKS